MYPSHISCQNNTSTMYNYTMAEYSHAISSQGNHIYVNKKFVQQQTSKNTVLVNPNFTRQVHVNPNFANKSVKTNTVFVNPNVFNKIGPRFDNQTICMKPNVESNINLSQPSKPIISTVGVESHVQNMQTQKNVSKYCKVNNTWSNSKMLPNNTGSKNVLYANNNLINTAIVKTKSKLIFAQKPVKSIQVYRKDMTTNKIWKSNPLITRHKLIRNHSNGKGVIKSKYKLVRRSSEINKNPMKMKQQLSRLSIALLNSPNRFKLDNRTRKPSCTIIKSHMKLTKKAYMMRLNPQNSIIKNTTFKLIRSTRRRPESGNKKKSEHLMNIALSTKQRTNVGKKVFTKPNLVKINKKKLQKNNIPCEIYSQKGVCKRFINGKCTKKHDPNLVQLCIWFLQGTCCDDKCSLSHKVSPEKMPTCKFFLEGICLKDNCPYLHVKLSKDAPVCRDFLNGYCAKARECDKRHQFLCPDYELDGRCSKKLCRYPHGKAVRQYKDTLLNVIARNKKSKPRKCVLRKEKFQKNKASIEIKDSKGIASTDNEIDTRRYYECPTSITTIKNLKEINVEEVINIFDRPKLGSLPSFISL